MTKDVNVMISSDNRKVAAETMHSREEAGGGGTHTCPPSRIQPSSSTSSRCGHSGPHTDMQALTELLVHQEARNDYFPSRSRACLSRKQNATAVCHMSSPLKAPTERHDHLCEGVGPAAALALMTDRSLTLNSPSFPGGLLLLLGHLQS